MNEATKPEARTAPSQGPSLAKIFLWLIMLFVVIVLLYFLMGYGEDGSHGMEGPAALVMISFMPLTAITYLHYRLPRKQAEFESIKSALHASTGDPEDLTFFLRREDSPADYIMPIFFVSVISSLGFYILFTNSAEVLFNGIQWVHAEHDTYRTEVYRRNIVSIAMAFLGAYIWSIQYIFRRMVTLDLPPGAYFSVGTRMIYSAFLAVIFQYLIPNKTLAVDGVITSQFIVISFLIGIFPERALTWMRESVGQIFAKPKVSADQLPLEMIEGISGFHKARLNELGIDSIQNLAHASVMELILKTPFKPRVLIDWMAQARLCLEFKTKTNGIRKAGIRTILDLQEIMEEYDEAQQQELAKISGISLSLINTIYVANRNEESIDRLRKAYDVLNIV